MKIFKSFNRLLFSKVHSIMKKGESMPEELGKREIYVTIDREGYHLENPEDVIENNKDIIARLSQSAQREMLEREMDEHRRFFIKVIRDIESKNKL